MKSTKMSTIVVLAVGLMVCFAQVSQAAPMGTAITYQGRLMDKNKPADGLYDFQFKLYDSNDPCTGTQLASPIDINDLDVIDGHFVVELDFGSDVFDGNSVWLETRVVRSPMGSDPATLSPLLELTPTPYAIYAKTTDYAQTAGGIPGGITGSGTANSVAKFTGPNTLGDSAIYEETGNVGIGTSTPETKLSIQMRGKPYPTLPPFIAPGLVIKGGSNNFGNLLEVQDWVGNTGFLVDYAGNVGIGTTSPDRTLEISGILRVAREANNAHGADFSYVVDEPVTGHDGLIIDSDTGGGWSDIHLRTGGTTKLFVESGGNVGIGTTNPDDLLNVWRDTSGSLGIRITNADVQGRAYALRVGGSDSAVGAGNFAIYDHNESATRLVVDSTGNVGIGTTDPNQKLDVEGNAVFSGYVGIGTTSPQAGLHLKGAGHPSSFMHIQSSNWDQDAGIRLYEASALKWHIFNDWENDGLRIYNSDGSDTVFFAEQSNGNVGIGTTSPDEKLTVVSSEAGSTAVYGEASDTSDLINIGGRFTAAGSYGRGIRGSASGIRGYGVYGTANNTGNYKNYGGYFTASGGVGRGVYGEATGNDGRGVYGVATRSSGLGVYGKHSASGNYGYLGGDKYAVYGSTNDFTDWAGYFNGHVHVNGTLTALVKLFKIDHPLDPENKYLNHTSVESSEMMNVYSGNVVLDENGEAQVQLPDWFEALNENFRYQLTAIGAPGPNLYIAEEISNNQFSIAGGTPGMKISWQVSGVRHDPYAEDNPLEVEEDKAPENRGYYRYPEGYGHGQEKSINSLHDSEAIEQFEEPESEVTDERS